MMRPLGAFVLVFLEAQIKSTCISRNSFCILVHKTMYNGTIIKFGLCDIRNNKGLAQCNYTCLDLDYYGYHKNFIQLFFIIFRGEYKNWMF